MEGAWHVYKDEVSKSRNTIFGASENQNDCADISTDNAIKYKIFCWLSMAFDAVDDYLYLKDFGHSSTIIRHKTLRFAIIVFLGSLMFVQGLAKGSLKCIACQRYQHN